VLKIAKYLKPCIPLFILGVMILILQAFCDLTLPNLMSHLVNSILMSKSAGSAVSASAEDSGILALGLRMLGVALTGGAAAIGVSFLSNRIAAGLARDLRSAVFQKVETFSSNEIDAFSSASLITRCTNDITQVQTIFVNGIRIVGYAPLMGIGGAVMAWRKAPAMSWIIILAVIILIGLVGILISIIMPKFRFIQDMVDRLNRIARETMNGLMVIRAFGAQSYEQKRFDSVNSDLTGANLFVNRVMNIQMPGMQFIMNAAILLIIWTGARHISASTMQVGDMMAFIQYTIQIIFAFNLFSNMFVLLPRTEVSAQRIASVLETDVSIKDPVSPQTPAFRTEPFSGNARGCTLEFKNVSFRYKGAVEDAVKDLCFTAEKGETTAIIGATGSGKTTIANLILRFYDVTGGSIAIDGIDIRELAQSDLRSMIGYVPQKSVLFSGSVAFNLRYGKPSASEGEVREGAEIAQALDFIEGRPEGFNSALAQGGANVSGGQKQRMAIARALVRDPEILIFDDSFSALDFATDSRLRSALEAKRKGVTKIIVAQRVGTIMHAEKIIVLEHGRIAGMGTHAELMETCPEYREIAETQLSEAQS